MPSMTPYSFGDVVLVGFPFTSLQTTKKRPAVVVSHSAYQKTRPDVILMAITSQIRYPLTTGEAIVQNWEAAGLVKPSIFKPLIATIEQSCIIKTLGKLSESDRKTLETVLHEILGS